MMLTNYLGKYQKDSQHINAGMTNLSRILTRSGQFAQFPPSQVLPPTSSRRMPSDSPRVLIASNPQHYRDSWDIAHVPSGVGRDLLRDRSPLSYAPGDGIR